MVFAISLESYMFQVQKKKPTRQQNHVQLHDSSSGWLWQTVPYAVLCFWTRLQSQMFIMNKFKISVQTYFEKSVLPFDGLVVIVMLV